MAATVVIPCWPPAADPSALARAAQAAGHAVVLAGPCPPGLPGAVRVEAATRDEALRRGLSTVASPLALVHAPDVPWNDVDVRALLQPLEADTADAAYAAAPQVPRVEQGLARLAQAVTGVALPDAFPALRAFRTAPAQAQLGRTPGAEAEDADAALLVKLAAQAFRVTHVQVVSGRPAADTALRLRRARTLLRYLGLQNDADNTHEGYNTLARMESAPHYNAWLGAQFRPWLGRRVLEVGAGIGTMTAQLAEGRELLVALEMDAFYVERLRNRFRGSPHVRPVLSGVEQADWARLRGEGFDSVVMSNVLEHIEDDVGALRNLRSVLPDGGRLVLFVPALQAVFGGLDEAVGHHRRYEAPQLRAAMEAGGFEVEHLQWMNLVGIPGWYLNSRLLGRRVMPPLQLRLFDAVAPWLARAESHVQLPIGLGLFAVGRARPA
jgi:SAM-dependent methyltransferase